MAIVEQIERDIASVVCSIHHLIGEAFSRKLNDLCVYQPNLAVSSSKLFPLDIHTFEAQSNWISHNSEAIKCMDVCIRRARRDQKVVRKATSATIPRRPEVRSKTVGRTSFDVSPRRSQKNLGTKVRLGRKRLWKMTCIYWRLSLNWLVDSRECKVCSDLPADPFTFLLLVQRTAIVCCLLSF